MADPTANMKVVLYARVSSERQAERDLSIPSQLKALRDYASKRGWQVYKEYVDEAESARSANRPKFQDMISATKQKDPPFKVILVWKLSRFARNREDSIIYKALLRKHGVQVVSINEQIDDSPPGRLLEGIIEVIDEFYSANLSHDTIRGMKENAGRGFLNGGTAPYGYKRVRAKINGRDKAKLDIEKSEAPVVKRMFKMCAEGMGTKEIVKELNDEGSRTRSGHQWSKTVVYYMLTNETYTGTLIFNRYRYWDTKALSSQKEDLIHVENTHTAIVDRKTFEKVKKVLKARGPKITHPRILASEYLLSGLLRCGVCGSKMVGCSAKSGKFFYYACQNYLKKGKKVCPSRLIPQSKVEAAVIEKLKARVLTDENLIKLVRMVNEELEKAQEDLAGQLEHKNAQIVELNGRLERLYNALETGKMDLDDLAPRIKALKARSDEIEASKMELKEKAGQKIQASASEIKAYVKDLRELLGSDSILQRKSFLKCFVKRIDLNKPQGGTIEYTLPLAPTKEKSRSGNGNGLSTTEVLSTVQGGCRARTRT